MAGPRADPWTQWAEAVRSLALGGHWLAWAHPPGVFCRVRPPARAGGWIALFRRSRGVTIWLPEPLTWLPQAPAPTAWGPSPSPSLSRLGARAEVLGGVGDSDPQRPALPLLWLARPRSVPLTSRCWGAAALCLSLSVTTPALPCPAPGAASPGRTEGPAGSSLGHLHSPVPAPVLPRPRASALDCQPGRPASPPRPPACGTRGCPEAVPGLGRLGRGAQ